MNYEIDFLPVGEGSGDAIVLRYGDDDNGYVLHVVDGGRTETGQTITDHINKYYANPHIAHMVLSHADDDHATGLVAVMKNFNVDHLWMNRPWLYVNQIIHQFHGNWSEQGLTDEIKRLHPRLVELEELAIEKGTQIHEAFQGAQIGAFTVLAPTKGRYINSIHEFSKTPTSYATEAYDEKTTALGRLLKTVVKVLENWDIETLANNTSTSASNESCVVQYANLDGKGVLLTADVGPIGLHEAADYRDALGLLLPRFVQVPHHGSRHNVTPDVLDRWLGEKVPEGTRVGTAFCSVGANKDEYPRAQVSNAFMRRGFKVFATRKTWISHYKGKGHPGMVPAVAEEFKDEVEPL